MPSSEETARVDEHESPVSPISAFTAAPPHDRRSRFHRMSYQCSLATEPATMDEPHTSISLPLYLQPPLPEATRSEYQKEPQEIGDWPLATGSDADQPSSRGMLDNMSQASTVRDPASTSEAFDHVYNNSPLTPATTQTSATISQVPGALLPSSSDRCAARRNIVTSGLSWYSTMFLFLALVTLALSVVALAVAHGRWHFKIGEAGMISYANATSLCATLAKVVELGLVSTVVVAIGQILSRRAVDANDVRNGISVAEISMRSWIVQPGTMLTHSVSLKYAGWTVLGVFAILTTFASTFYTTAAEALVYPKLRLGTPVVRHLSGAVETSFGNAVYLRQRCSTPIHEEGDDMGLSCLHIGIAGQSFHNFQSYLGAWGVLQDQHNSTIDSTQFARPQPQAIFDDGDDMPLTAILGQWLSNSDAAAQQPNESGRLVQRISMAMPHLNVAYAARDPINQLIQPVDLGGEGEYNISAAVPSPAIHIVCAALHGQEAKPFVKGSTDTTSALDNVFKFGRGAGQQQRPFFEKDPKPYNTVANIYQATGLDALAVYVLAGAPAEASAEVRDYVLCSIAASQYDHCTTRYHVAEAGAQISVHCDESVGNDLPYRPTSGGNPPAYTSEPDFQNVADEWLRAIALNNGIADSNAQIARLLAQMIPDYSAGTETATLPFDRPSIGEALALLAARPLLMSTIRAPFVETFNYTAPNNIIAPGAQRQSFKAIVTSQAYISGPLQPWQNIFYVILWTACGLSAMSTFYLFWIYGILRQGEITDFTEPQNAFVLAMNSPPALALDGTCGAGPEDAQWQLPWKIRSIPAPDRYGRLGRHYFWSGQETQCSSSESQESLTRSTRWRRGKVYESA